MNEQKRMRLVMLCGALVIFGSGIGAWMLYQNEKQQELQNNMTTMTPRVQLASQNRKDATVAAAPAAGKSTAAAATKEKLTTADATPVSAAKTASSKVASALTSKQPAAAAPAAQTSKPPAVAQPAPASKAPGAVLKPAAAPGKQPASQAIKAAGAQQQPAAPKAPTHPALPNGQPLHPPVVPLAKAPAAAKELAAETATAQPLSGEVVRATSFVQASHDAHKDIGRSDPTKGLEAFLPFPRAIHRDSDSQSLQAPPAIPAGDKTQAADKNEPAGDQKNAGGSPLVPPPPPSDEANDLGIDDLPPPPDKPHIAEKLKVLAVIGDHAIIAFPLNMCQKNNWPRTITLATGQQFDSIKVVQVSGEGVTVEEDGERSLKPVPAIK